ncbi:hypothetical protein [Micromonospora sp. NPDC049497]|uniref:hypothetical protein n=1 Tax=Micromonospora sp. NPDC049497 TaxID=3364273 RepID=UPI0037B47A18
MRGLEDQIAVALSAYTEKSVSAARVAPPTVAEAPPAPEDRECSWVKPVAC